MSDDGDLQTMFDAQRECDERAAPEFDWMHAEAVDLPVDPPSSPWAKVAILFSAAALLLFVVSMWDSRPTGDNAARVAKDDLDRLNQRCDSLLASIQQARFESTVAVDEDLSSQMDWPDVTDSLIPFDTLASHTRTPR